MKRLISIPLIVIGAGICLWAAKGLLVDRGQTWVHVGGRTVHPVYGGLVGIAVLTAGILCRQD